FDAVTHGSRGGESLLRYQTLQHTALRELLYTFAGHQGRHEVSSPFGHHLRALIVEKGTVLDRGDTGPHCYLDAFGTMSMSCHTAAELVCLITEGFHFLIGVLCCTDRVAFTQYAAGRARFDHVGSVFDHVTHRGPHLFWSVSNAILDPAIDEPRFVAVLIAV